MRRRNESKRVQLIQTNQKEQKLIQESESDTNASVRSSSSQGGEQSSKPKKGQKQKEKKKFSWPVYRNLLRYSLKRWPLALTSIVMNIVSGLGLSLIPWKIGNVLDVIGRAREDPSLDSEFKHEVFLLGMIILVTSIVHIFRFLSTQIIQQKLLLDMRTDIYAKFINFDLTFFQKYKSGQLISRLGSDINQAKSAISNNLTFLIRNIVTIIGNIIILLIISWQLTMFVLLIVPVYGAVTVIYNRKNKVLTRQYQDIQAEMSAMTGQKFTGIQVVKAFVTEDYQVKKYGQINEKGYKCALKRTYWWSMYFVCSQALPNIGTLIVLWYGGQQIIDGAEGLTPGQLTSFIIYCTALASNTSGISNSYSNIINGTHAVQKVFQMLGYQPDINQNQGRPEEINGEVHFKNVTFKYPQAEAPIITDFNLKFREGQYVAIVGQSGSGKSTVVKLLQRFYKLTDGKIFFGQHDSDSINIKNLRKQIGLVNQQATLFAGSIEENITYGLEEYTFDQLQQAAQKSGCMEFIGNARLFPLAFKTQIGQRGAQLSGGQRQRISIARALMRRPKILIFDEATSALDTNSQAMVQKSIQHLSQIQSKITIIVIAHRLSTVINAERIIVMKEGKIIEEGTHNQLRAKGGYYYQLVQKQLTEQTVDKKVE